MGDLELMGLLPWMCDVLCDQLSENDGRDFRKHLPEMRSPLDTALGIAEVILTNFDGMRSIHDERDNVVLTVPQGHVLRALVDRVKSMSSSPARAPAPVVIPDTVPAPAPAAKRARVSSGDEDLPSTPVLAHLPDQLTCLMMWDLQGGKTVMEAVRKYFGIPPELTMAQACVYLEQTYGFPLDWVTELFSRASQCPVERLALPNKIREMIGVDCQVVKPTPLLTNVINMMDAIIRRVTDKRNMNEEILFTSLASFPKGRVVISRSVYVYLLEYLTRSEKVIQNIPWRRDESWKADWEAYLKTASYTVSVPEAPAPAPAPVPITRANSSSSSYTYETEDE